MFVYTRSSWLFHSGSHIGTARFVVYCTCAKYRVVEYYRVCCFRDVILECFLFQNMLDKYKHSFHLAVVVSMFIVVLISVILLSNVHASFIVYLAVYSSDYCTSRKEGCVPINLFNPTIFICLVSGTVSLSCIFLCCKILWLLVRLSSITVHLGFFYRI